MSLRDDRRAQSIQIGAVLLFGVLIILFATYQAFVVPDQNREVEGNHVGTITQQMQEVRNAIVSMPGSGGGQSITLTLGVEYPSRVIALNPPSPTGTVRTLGTTTEDVNLTVANAVATDGEVDDYWTGTNQTLNTGSIAFRPGYNEYQNPPTIVYENSLLYHQFRNGNLTRAGQRVIDGRTISLVAVNGSLDRSASDSVAVDLQDVSSSSRQITVTNEPNERLIIDVPSRYNASQWETELAETGDYDDPNGYVADVTKTSIPNSEFDVVHLHLAQDEDYDLRMAKVGLGTGVTGTDPKYITAATAQDVQPGESFTAEVRDGLNNPVSGVTVQPDGCDLDPQRTDTNGQATFSCDQQGTVELQIKDGNQANETVSFGTGASADGQAPSIQTQETTATSEERCDLFVFTSCAQYVYQITQDYSVSDSQSGLDSISLQLYDETGTLVTETSRTLNGVSSHEGRWKSPWINADEDDVQDYEVHVEAVDVAGNVATCIAGIGAGSCQTSQSSTDMADTIALSGDGSTVGGSGQSRISFDLANNGQSEARITHLTVDSVSGSETGNEIYINNGDTISGSETSYYQSRINQDDQVQLTTPAIIDAGEVDTFNLGQFRTGPGNGNRENMGGETVEITLQFSDGSQESYTIDVT